MNFHPMTYGVTTVGARGQIVIPIKARSDLKLKEGDQLVVFGHKGKFLGLVKNEEVSGIIDNLLSKMTSRTKELKKWKTSLK
ncbi:MAG: AbrB/MazE/SpoVT family DNA-binding domain-containing protein [bacterium]